MARPVRCGWMEDVSELLERRIPDVSPTAGLPARLAAEIDFLAGRVDRWCDLSEKYTPAITARALASIGRLSEAMRALDEVDVAAAPVTDVAAAAWAASRVGGPAVRTILARLDAERSDFLDGAVPMGPRWMYTGMLRGALGDLVPAADDLEAALAVGDVRAPLWGALCRLELGRVLRTAESLPQPGLRPAEPVLAAARMFFRAGGYRSLQQRVDGASGPTEAYLELAAPGRVGFGVQPGAEVNSGKGLVAIAHLVTNAHRVVSAAELAALLDGRDAAGIAALTTERLASDWELESEADGGRGIRSVLFDDATRSRVTKLVRRTIAALTASHRLVGEHLAASVVTGHGCRYRPAGTPPSWSIARRD